jgi:hypothetical protein
MSNSDAILDRTKPVFKGVIPFRIDQNGQRNASLTVRILNGITVSLSIILAHFFNPFLNCPRFTVKVC